MINGRDPGSRQRRAARRAGTALAVALGLTTAPGIAEEVSAECRAQLANRAISLIIPHSGGGGYDTYARAIAPVLEDAAGTRVSVANVVGGNGVLAMSMVALQSGQEILIGIDGMADVVSTLDVDDSVGIRSEALTPLGIIHTEPESWVGLPGLDLADPALDHMVFTTSSLQANLLAMAATSLALGFELDVVAGYGGSREAAAAILRGEGDVTTPTLGSALRNVEGVGLSLLLVIDDAPSPLAPGVRSLLGPDGLFELRAGDLPPAEREARLQIAETVIELGATRRFLYTAAAHPPELLACLRDATDIVLADPALAEVLAARDRLLDPVASDEALEIYQRVRAAFAGNRGLIDDIFADYLD